MTLNSSYGLPAEILDVIVVDDSKPMQLMIRSMLHNIHPRRVRCFDTAEEALDAMLVEPPNLIITDWQLSGMSGYQLLRTIRLKQMAPLSFVPLLVVSSNATRRSVERAFRAGASHFLVKPLSAACLSKWINRVLKDKREFVLSDTGHYVIEGVAEALAVHRGRQDTLERARLFHDRSVRRVVEAQSHVDRILAKVINPDILEDDTDFDGPRMGPMVEAEPAPAMVEPRGPERATLKPLGRGERSRSKRMKTFSSLGGRR
ncbi:Chemotaxis protein CheY [Hartmannibacter diazotrophicus]|uniref:Chemotaxis protein CheY n=2 Tax=Hartmannibacter diazotrophicus TaxID=1482074 RepID=A0A2C9D526_9HYPH|nr:Chemotaxis protein CheY [Hartmannibacter diazotrophicus]